jgi:hypothetical protein
MAWVQIKNPQQPVQHQLTETISPERLTVGHGPLPESKFNDMSFVFTEN